MAQQFCRWDFRPAGLARQEAAHIAKVFFTGRHKHAKPFPLRETCPPLLVQRMPKGTPANQVHGLAPLLDRGGKRRRCLPGVTTQSGALTPLLLNAGQNVFRRRGHTFDWIVGSHRPVN